MKGLIPYTSHGERDKNQAAVVAAAAGNLSRRRMTKDYNPTLAEHASPNTVLTRFYSVSKPKGRPFTVNQGDDDALAGPRLLAPAPDSLVLLAAAGVA